MDESVIKKALDEWTAFQNAEFTLLSKMEAELARRESAPLSSDPGHARSYSMRVSHLKTRIRMIRKRLRLDDG